MILVGFGSNLAAPQFGAPAGHCGGGLAELPQMGVRIARRSALVSVGASAARPINRGTSTPSRQCETALGAGALLAALQALETRFGRRRGEPNAARTLDLDLLDYRRPKCATAHADLAAPAAA